MRAAIISEHKQYQNESICLWKGLEESKSNQDNKQGREGKSHTNKHGQERVLANMDKNGWLTDKI